jgi:hypothetical protein
MLSLRPVRYRPLSVVFSLSAALLAALAAGCAQSPGEVTLCGGPETPLAAPPPPTVGSFPKVTSLTTLPVAGRRYPDTAVRIDDVEAVPVGCDRFWTTDLDLPVEGDNTFSLVAEASSLNRSDPVMLTITRDTTAPAMPNAVPAVPSTANGTVTVTGDREAGADLRLNGRPVVPPDGGTAFSVEVALAAGANDLSFTAVDAAGNESPAKLVSVTRTSAALPIPRMIYPLRRQRLPDPAFTFYWGSVPLTGLDHYQLQVSDAPGFVGGTYGSVNPTDDNLTLSMALALPGPGTYYWRIGSVDGSGVVTYGPTRAFRVGSVASDVNGDGYTDVVAGVPGWDGGRDILTQDNRGRANLYFGGATMGNTATETPAVQFPGTASGEQFGIAVTVGDLNGDGMAEVIAGAHRSSARARSAGRAYIFLGAATPSETAELILNGQNFDDGFGQEVASGFDLNADGYEDLAVGAWQHDGDTGDLGDNRGRVFVFLGGAELDNVPDLILTGGQALENFGSTVSGGFDLNGDGYDDLAVGGPIADGAGGTIVGAGRALVYYGGPWVDPVADLTLEGQSADEHFGSAVSGAGDMDGDGFDELVSGSPAWEIGGDASRGRAQVFRGALSPATTPAVSLEGAGGCEAFGFTLGGGGDLNGDGYADLAVGIPYSDLGGPNPPSCDNFDTGDLGAVEIHYGAATLDTTADGRFTGEAANDWLGLGLHMTADVNGDTFDDLVFGAPANDQGSSLFGDVGRGYVLFGRAAGWVTQQSAANVNTVVPGAILSNDIGKDGLGGAVW